MVHKVIGWLAGYVTIRLRDGEIERFVNMCRYKEIPLWNVYWDTKRKHLYADISLKNFWRLRPIVRKTHAVPVVVKRHGGPFLLSSIQKRASFFAGLILFLAGIIFLAGRIWGISFEGEQYHTEESLRRFLNESGVYMGMPSKGLSCTELAKQIRRRYQDIGWVSVEKKGSCLFVRLQEVTLMKEKKDASSAADLIAAHDGKVISIVTREGTPQVHAGAKVKKGDVLISGKVEVIGDGDVIQNIRFVRAKGTVVIEGKKEYNKYLSKTYQKHGLEKHKKNVYCLRYQQNRFFLHNPLNRLESGRKYAIITESGQLCSKVIPRSPFYWVKASYQEMYSKKMVYTRKQAKKKLLNLHREYIRRQEEDGYQIQETAPEFQVLDSGYKLKDTVIWWSSHHKYRKISVSERKKQKEEIKTDGNYGNAH